MRLSQSLHQALPEEQDALEPHGRAKVSAAAVRDGAETTRGRPRLVFVGLARADTARIRCSFPLDRCDVVVIDDAEPAVARIGDTVPDVVVCPQRTWGIVGDRVGQALSRRGVCRPVVVLLLPVAEGDKRASPRDATTVDDNVLQAISSVIRIVSEARCGSGGQTLTHADITLDPITRRVTRGDRPLRLSQTSFRLLHILMAEPERVYSREELLRDLRGERIHVAVRTVDALVKRLRRAFTVFGGPDVIRTVRGVGYAFGHDIWSTP